MTTRHGLSSPYVTLTLTSLALRVATTALLSIVHRLLPSFDASAQHLASVSSSFEAFVRWDTVYFLTIARDGYAAPHEQRLAFFPALPAVLRFGSDLIARASARRPTFEDMVVAGFVATAIATTASAILLYKLTWTISQSRRFSFATSVLWLLGPARAVLHAVPYTEPFAALFTFAGMSAFVLRDRDLSAAILFACATAFRAQGAVLGLGFFGWRYILEQPFSSTTTATSRFPIKLSRGVVVTSVLSFISASPFFAFQAFAYREYCSDSTRLRPWCTSSRFGFSYGWIQSHYWDVGPFRYWTVQQLPNFLLAAPVLAMSFAASYDYYTHRPRFVVAKTFPFLESLTPSLTHTEEEDDEEERSKRRRRGRGAGGPFFSPALLPFVHLHTATTVLLSVSAHVQIVLRLCSANPVVWWYVADLVLAGRREGDDEGAARREDCTGRDRDETAATRLRRRSMWGQRWIVYTVVWGTVSIICWALFLPPA